jgi:ornithine cyclodeaminase/alanine dehydrogenase-like protein (mu-crystallin family)
MSLRILSARDVERITAEMDVESLLEIASRTFEIFTSRAGYTMPQRLLIESSRATTLFMPARVEYATAFREDVMTVKIVSVPSSGSGGLPATVLVFDETTGGVKGCINARRLTALRTAAG